MPPQLLTNPQHCSPSDVTLPATVAAAGVAWTPTAAVELAPSTDVVWILSGLSVWADRSANASTDFEVDVVTGASLNVVIGTLCGRVHTIGLELYAQPITLPIGIDNLNGRHGYILRTGDTRTDTWHVKATYYKNPVNGLYLTTRQPSRVAPSGAAPVVCTASASAWVFGSPTTLIASAAADLIVTHMLLEPLGNGEMEVELYADAASVIPIYRFCLSRPNFGQGEPYLFTFQHPLDKIPAGSLVSIRCRAAMGSTTCAAKMTYFHKPL